MNEEKYGNDFYWCFLPDGWDRKEVAIWKGPSGSEEIIARASNKYDAKTIVDALLKHTNLEESSQLSKKELVFLDFLCSNCVEPYATMAENAKLWNDKTAYEKLKSEFPIIYS